MQLVLEEIGCDYRRLDATGLYPGKSVRLKYPGMAPPYLYDCKARRYMAQMPAIMMYLGEKHGLMPRSLESRYLALKVIADCHDVLLEITNCYGENMWRREDWKEFRQGRFANWLRIFEKTGRLTGLKRSDRFLLGPALTVADLAVTALLGPILYTFPDLEPDIKTHAPYVHSLCRRIEARPRIARLLREQRTEWGDIYCGGQIEKSLRKMMRTL